MIRLLADSDSLEELTALVEEAHSAGRQVAAHASTPEGIRRAVLGASFFVIVGLISSTLNSIYTAAVYQYATTGQSGQFFDNQLVENAFRQK